MMSRQTELMVKISIVGLEITYVAGIALTLQVYLKSHRTTDLIAPIVLILGLLIFNLMLFCYRE
jgi:hypothetical protein